MYECSVYRPGLRHGKVLRIQQFNNADTYSNSYSYPDTDGYTVSDTDARFVANGRCWQRPRDGRRFFLERHICRAGFRC